MVLLHTRLGYFAQILSLGVFIHKLLEISHYLTAPEFLRRQTLLLDDVVSYLVQQSFGFAQLRMLVLIAEVIY